MYKYSIEYLYSKATLMKIQWQNRVELSAGTGAARAAEFWMLLTLDNAWTIRFSFVGQIHHWRKAHTYRSLILRI